MTMTEDTPLLSNDEETGIIKPAYDDESSHHSEDSDDWEDSDNEAWPTSNSRYAPVGDTSKRPLGSSRLAREFTMGAGFSHLTTKGQHTISSSPRGTVLSLSSEYYTKGALDLIAAKNMAGLCVGKPTYLGKVLLVTDAPHTVTIYSGEEDGKPCVVGIALSRDGVVFTSGILSDENEPLTLELDQDTPIMDCIKLQSCTWLEEGDRLEKKISYLYLSRSGTPPLVFGKVQPEGFDGNNSIYSKVEAAHGKLLLSGIGYFDNKPLTLQVVDLGAECTDEADAMNATVYYDQHVISANCIRDRLPAVDLKGSIITEDDKVWTVLLGCMDAVENSSPSYGELLPNAVNLLERSLAGDVHTAMAVLRLDRFLTYTIQEKRSVQTFDNDHLNFYSKLIPMKQMWGILSNAVERIKRINTDQPSLNSFSVAFLYGTKKTRSTAIFKFLMQLGLLALTSSYVCLHSEDVFVDISPLRWLVSVCGTVLVGFMVIENRESFYDFASIFPDYKGTFFYYLDWLMNVAGGVVVACCTLFLLLEANESMDVVLNATALFFIMEVDTLTVDSNPIWVTGTYRSYFIRDIIKNLKESDKRYWDPQGLRKNRGAHYRIHLPSCSFLFEE